MAKIDLDDIKRQIKALTASSATREPNAEKLRVLSAQRRKEVEQIVGPAFAQTGVDIAALREKLAKNERTFRDEFKRLQVPQAETIAERKSAFQKSVDLRRAAIEKIGRRVTVPGPSVIVNLPEPVYITQSATAPYSPYDFANVTDIPDFLQGNPSIAPNDSRVKFFVRTDISYSPTFDFWYLWTNDSSLESLVSVTAPLVFNGSVFGELVSAGFGISGEGWNTLDLRIFSMLEVYQKGPYPDIVLDTVDEMNLVTHFWSEDFQSINLDHRRSQLFLPPWQFVPGGDSILLRVRAGFDWSFRDEWGPDDRQAGNVMQLDFASDSLNHFVQSPGVTIEITGPIVAEPMASG
jgi:hypothetical protein